MNSQVCLLSENVYRCIMRLCPPVRKCPAGHNIIGTAYGIMSPVEMCPLHQSIHISADIQFEEF